jgi:23S rRNA (uracil1939-C5)-methyltransferase
MPISLIESLDHEGRGVTRLDGTAVFADGALPFEKAELSIYRKKRNFALANVIRIVHPSAQRVTPRCPYFNTCGGCSMQHLEASAQAAVKQRVLEDAFWHIARLRPEMVFPAIQGSPWGYRFRARFSVRLVPRKGGVLVGFHEKRSSYVVDMQSCDVLPAHVSAIIPALRQLVGALSIADRLPQIEVALGEGRTALVLRTLKPLEARDESLLRTFAGAHGVTLFVQPAGPGSAYAFHPPDAGELSYTLPDFDLRLRFRPTDFTQVNFGVNRMLVRRALGLLAPRRGEHIADMYCGLGNFALAIARCGSRVVGFEGSEDLVRRACENAECNGLADLCEFVVADLSNSPAPGGRFDKMLIDPPREGAIGLVRGLDSDAPHRIVYVSCNPATLARDAAVLVHEKGYALRGAGIANMFPHTSHVESIAVFQKQ